MRIIFLDIDGVLNSEAWFHKRNAMRKEGQAIEHPDDAIDPEALERLSHLCNTTGAKIVISSTWRHGRDAQFFQDLFQRLHKEFKGEVIDVTPSLRGGHGFRGNEIHLWMREHEDLIGPLHDYYDYVILDDDSDMLYWHRNNFLLVDRTVGLTQGTVFQARRIFRVPRDEDYQS